MDELQAEMCGTLEQSLKEAFNVGWFFGYSLGEIIPRKSCSKKFAGKKIIHKIRSLRTGLVEFDLDYYDEIRSIHSLVAHDLLVKF